MSIITSCFNAASSLMYHAVNNPVTTYAANKITDVALASLEYVYENPSQAATFCLGTVIFSRGLQNFHQLHQNQEAGIVQTLYEGAIAWPQMAVGTALMMMTIEGEALSDYLNLNE